MKVIAVIMTVYNRKEKTLSCLRNLTRQGLPEGYTCDVWLTDDGCNDGTPEAIRTEFPNVNIVKGDGTLYWNRGMWTAWEAASRHHLYDYYLWLNDDTLLYNESIKRLIEVSNMFDDKSCIVGPTQSLNHCGISYGGYNRGKIITPTGTPTKVEYFNGNIVLVPDYVFKKIGNLDYYYRHGHGDTDYGLRANEAGMCNYMVGEYLGECDRNSSLKKCWDPKIRISERFKNLYMPLGYPPREDFYFQKKHFGLISAISHILKLYARVMFPKVWCRLGKAKP